MGHGKLTYAVWLIKEEMDEIMFERVMVLAYDKVGIS